MKRVAKGHLRSKRHHRACQPADGSAGWTPEGLIAKDDVFGAASTADLITVVSARLSPRGRQILVTHSPALTDGSEPTTVKSSRWPLTCTFRTAKPFSSLKKVTPQKDRHSVRPRRVIAQQVVADEACRAEAERRLLTRL